MRRSSTFGCYSVSKSCYTNIYSAYVGRYIRMTQKDVSLSSRSCRRLIRQSLLLLSTKTSSTERIDIVLCVTTVLSSGTSINSSRCFCCSQFGRQLRCRRIRWLGVAEGGGWRPAAAPSAPPSSRFPASVALQLHGYLLVVHHRGFPGWVP